MPTTLTARSGTGEVRSGRRINLAIHPLMLEAWALYTISSLDTSSMSTAKSKRQSPSGVGLSCMPRSITPIAQIRRRGGDRWNAGDRLHLVVPTPLLPADLSRRLAGANGVLSATALHHHSDVHTVSGTLRRAK